MKILPTFLFLFTFILSNAQPTIDWQQTYGGTADDISPVVISTADQGLLIAGSTQSLDNDVTSNHGYYDIWVLKLDANGVEEWQKSYGGSQGDFVNAVIQSSDGSYILTGSSQSSDGNLTENKGLADLWIFKINSAGDIIWQHTYGGSDNEDGKWIMETSDSQLWVAGNTESSDGDVFSNHGMNDIWLLKLNSDGSLNWEKTYGGTYDDYGCAVAGTDSSHFILAGYSYSDDGDIGSHYDATDKCDYVAIKISDAGDLVWSQNYGGNENDHLIGMYPSYDGFLLYGTSDSNNGNITGSHGFNDGWIIKIDADAGVLWQKSLGGTANDDLVALLQNSDGYLYAAGSTRSVDGDISSNKGEADCWLMKLDPSGPLQWGITMGGAMTDISKSLALTTDQDLVLGASTYSSDGDITNNIGLYDYWIVKTSTIAGVDDTKNNKTITVWPNPSDGRFTVNFDMSQDPSVFTISDVNGRIILQKTLSGNNTENIDISSLPSGIYFMKIQNNSFDVNKKIIIY